MFCNLKVAALPDHRRQRLAGGSRSWRLPVVLRWHAGSSLARTTLVWTTSTFHGPPYGSRLCLAGRRSAVGLGLLSGVAHAPPADLEVIIRCRHPASGVGRLRDGMWEASRPGSSTATSPPTPPVGDPSTSPVGAAPTRPRLLKRRPPPPPPEWWEGRQLHGVSYCWAPSGPGGHGELK